MIIRDLKLIDFRNLKNCELSFDKKRNLIYGPNGAGKTSVLESIFLLAFGKSFLNRKKSDMASHDSAEFIVRLSCASTYGVNHISAGFDSRYSLFVNQKKSTIFDVSAYLYPVFFSSSDYNLYIESVSYTRKMIDRFLFGVNSLYIRFILGYNKALKQKNHLLKKSQNRSELSSWNKTISELSEKIVGKKMALVEKLNQEIMNKFDRDLTVVYRPSFNLEAGIAERSFYGQLQAIHSRELKAQRSLLGPHLDGYDLYLNSRPLKFYSSGEKKIHLLMIYISYIELFKRIREEYPVFLLDDFDTAIDKKNLDFLMNNYPEMQVLATSVSKNPNFDRYFELTKEN